MSQCINCFSNLREKNYCICCENNSFCYECVQKMNINEIIVLKKDVQKVVQNQPIIHLDKYNDDFSFYDFFFRLK